MPDWEISLYTRTALKFFGTLIVISVVFSVSTVAVMEEVFFFPHKKIIARPSCH